MKQNKSVLVIMVLAIGLASSLLVVKNNQDTRNRAAGFTDYTVSTGGMNDDSRVVTGGGIAVTKDGLRDNSDLTANVSILSNPVRKVVYQCTTNSGCIAIKSEDVKVADMYAVYDTLEQCEKACSKNGSYMCDFFWGCVGVIGNNDSYAQYETIEACESGCPRKPTYDCQPNGVCGRSEDRNGMTLEDCERTCSQSSPSGPVNREY